MDARRLFGELAAHEGGVVLVGLIQPGSADGHIAFSHSGCNDWVDIPEDAVTACHPIGLASCADHEHHHVRLFLRRPATPEGAAFADLLKGHQRLSRDLTARLTAATGGGDDPDCPGGYVDVRTGQWRCP